MTYSDLGCYLDNRESPSSDRLVNNKLIPNYVVLLTSKCNQFMVLLNLIVLILPFLVASWLQNPKKWRYAWLLHSEAQEDSNRTNNWESLMYLVLSLFWRVEVKKHGERKTNKYNTINQGILTILLVSSILWFSTMYWGETGNKHAVKEQQTGVHTYRTI